MHGMIMVVYLLTAFFLGGFGNYLIPLMVGARDMVFPWLNMISFWVYLLSYCCWPPVFCRRRLDGRGLDAVSTAGHFARYTRFRGRHFIDACLTGGVHHWLHDGWL